MKSPARRPLATPDASDTTPTGDGSDGSDSPEPGPTGDENGSDDAPGNSGTRRATTTTRRGTPEPLRDKTTATRTETTCRETRATLRVRTRSGTTTTRAAVPEARANTGPRRRLAWQLRQCPRPHQGQQSGMRVTRQARAGGAASLGQRAPRLVFRVALFSALTLGIGAATLLVFIRHFERTRAEETATLHASVAAQAVVDRLRPPISPGRSRKDAARSSIASSRRVLDEATPASAIATAGRPPRFRDGGRCRSAPLTRELLGTALGGTVASELIATEVKEHRRRCSGLTRRSASRTARSACSSWTRTTGR